jgi:UDP-N-acetylmuramoyl-L-alanyl-D-glutamate--2,6-diaminopimelate ligase
LIETDILHGFRRPEDVTVLADRAQAIAWALSRAECGDTVLIAGKGHEKYQIVGNRLCDFDDCEVARTWLYQNQPLGAWAA